MPRGGAKRKIAAGARQPNGNGATLGFEAKLWAAADALRNNMDTAEYKHVVLGLIFQKYISDAFEAKHAELEYQKAEGADPEDPEGEIRKAIIEVDLVDCMVALPSQLFYSTQIPVCLWFLARTRGTAVFATGAARRCSSTRAGWDGW